MGATSRAKQITIRHTYTAEEVTEFRRISAARKKLDEDQRALVAAVRKDPQAKSAALLAGYAQPPEVTLGHNDATLVFTVREMVTEDTAPEPEKPASPPPPPTIYMDPKTLNTLLNGKLLSDAQKRTLIERTHQGLCGFFAESPQ